MCLGELVNAIRESAALAPVPIQERAGVAGFSASMVLGPFVGAIADRFGRKVMILLGYCTLYGLACVTKHFNTLPVLYLGRLFGGLRLLCGL